MVEKISLSARNVVKRYGGVTALADGTLEIRAGEVLALVGANGSGKSTLSKIITGVVAPDDGQLMVDGQPTRFASPQAAKKNGITAVYQELSLVPHLSVAENIWLGHQPHILGFSNRFAMYSRTRDLLKFFEGTYSRNLTPEALVGKLAPDERQIIEILKAMSIKPRLMILDEATASLDSQQVNRLFDLVQRWKTEGMALAIVTHRMEEIFRLADRATVLRNGRTVGTVDIRDVNEQQLVEMMVEHTANPRGLKIAQPENLNAPVRLTVQNLHSNVLKGVDLTLRDGELLGIGGLQGQGQADLLLAIFGAIAFTGSIHLAGQPVHFRHPSEAMRREVAFVPGDRGSEGLLLIRSILDNFQLPSWNKYGFPLKMERARADAQQTAQNLRLVYAGLDAPVNSLSGGNAQKVVIGKWLLRNPKLLLLNDPTKGVDVGAKGEFYHLLTQLREAGTAILFYSSDDDELLGLCDRVLVLHDGKIRAELSGDHLNRTSLVAASMGQEL